MNKMILTQIPAKSTSEFYIIIIIIQGPDKGGGGGGNAPKLFNSKWSFTNEPEVRFKFRF